MAMTAPVPSSGLSPERLEEIEKAVTFITHEMVTGLRDAHDCGDDDEAEEYACAIDAVSDLLAEVRRLQGENERLRTPAAVETLDDDALDTRDWLETAARVFRGVVASAERGAEARLISSQDDIDDARCMADAIERVVRDLDWAREGYRRDVEDTLSQVSDADAEINDLRQQLASAREETARFRKALAGDDPEMPEGLWPIETIAAAVDYAEDEHAWKAEHSTVRADEDPDATWECIRDAIAVVRELRSIVRSRSLPGETADA